MNEKVQKYHSLNDFTITQNPVQKKCIFHFNLKLAGTIYFVAAYVKKKLL